MPQLTEDQLSGLAAIAVAEQQAAGDEMLRAYLLTERLSPEAYVGSDVPPGNSANMKGINTVRADWNGNLGGGTPGNPVRVPKTGPRFDA